MAHWRNQIVAVMIAIVSPALAHPGRGIVVDEQQRVYVADAVRSVVWRVDPDGRVSPAARDVHAHWLSIDAAGRVLADDLHYDAANDAYPRGLVRLSDSGPPEQIIEKRPDPHGLDAGAFCATPDRLAIARESTHTIERRAGADVRGSIPLSASEKTVNAITCTDDASLLAVRGREVLRIRPDNQVAPIANIPEQTCSAPVSGLHDLWGVASNKDGDLFTTDPGCRRVLRLSPSGEVSTVHTATEPWFPTGVACQGSTLYILEHGLEGEQNLGPRVTILEPGKPTRVLATITDQPDR